MKNQILGRQGEQVAAEFLKQKGYAICARNFRVSLGEIDIIAKADDVLAFVEVKTRRGCRYGTPAQAVNYYKQRKIIQTAKCFLRQHHLEDECRCRFDVLEVYALPGNKWQVHHLPGAFES